MLLSDSTHGQDATNATVTASNQVPTAESIWARPTLGGDWWGLRPQLKKIGLDLRIELTQFESGMLSGEGSKSWEYGGKLDGYLTFNAAQAGLWQGLFLVVRGQQNYGDDLEGAGGTLVPNNASLAFPGPSDGDVGIEITQKFSDVIALRFGKLNMVDAAKATPIKGGGGIDTFMNTALAVPPTGLVPPEIFGGILSVNTKPVSYAVMVYDPISAEQRSGFESPFSEGVSFCGRATLSAKPFGRQGFYGIKAMYSTMQGFDLRSIPDLILPPETPTVMSKTGHPYYFGVSVQQYLFQDAKDPKRGWGIFGEVGFSDGNPTPQQWAGYFGLAGTNPLFGRAADRWGVGLFRNSLSDRLVEGLAPVLELRDEQGLELFYNFAVAPWLYVTPDLQVVRPFLDHYPNAIFASLRVNVRF